MTKHKRINAENFINQKTSSPDFQDIISRIGEGAIFVYPTETIYGIGGIALSSVEERIYDAKVRKPDNPMLLISSSLDHFSCLNLEINQTAQKLADKFWPGNLTMILPHKDDKDKKTGIRVSSHPFIKKLCDNIKQPIFSTSANISGEEYKNDPEFIFHTFNDKIDMIFDMGVLPPSPPSTVVMVTGEKVNILREGVIPSTEINSVPAL